MTDHVAKEEHAAKQRRFYLNLFPQGGHVVAKNIGGFTDPGDDGKEAEMKAALENWMRMQSSGAIVPIFNDAWWMTRFMDPYARKNKLESDARHNELMSFAVAVVSDLVEDGYLQWSKEPAVPYIVTSDHGLIDDVDQAVLDRLEASFNKKQKEKQQDGE